MPTRKLFFINTILICLIGCNADLNDQITDDTHTKNEKVIRSLPFSEDPLDNFDIFKSSGKNWQLARDIYTDYNDGSIFELEEGTGILVNKMNESGNEALFSNFDHGDIELQFEYLIPKGSNSGAYFQGRYELQLYDSYGVEIPKTSDSGAIYERWDDSKPKGSKGYEGHPPLVNTSKAPGLWQEMKVYFRAPKFDKEGNKTENARFESVHHNGILIQDDVELYGPTRGPFIEGEAAYGPLVIQGDHGNIAFRNIKYKSYSQDSLELFNLTYKYFEHPDDESFPEFDTVQILKEGKATFLDPNIANEKEDYYGLIFNGQMKVPKTGNYLFKSRLDDGGDLFINGKLITHNEDTGQTMLDSGEVDFELRYFENAWLTRISIDYEGPNIYVHPLGRTLTKKKNNRNKNEILIESVSEPEIYRNFSMYNGSKRTHALSVGTPAKIHYTYDLNEGALLKFWRGDFANMSDMWINRGEPQLLQPLNAAVESIDGIPLGTFNNDQSKWASLDKDQVLFKEYDITAEGYPVFHYKSNDATWTDIIHPDANGLELKRTITKTSGSKDIGIRIASGNKIKKLPSGLYSIDGKYYIKLKDATEGKVLNSDGNELILPFDNNGIVTYNVFW